MFFQLQGIALLAFSVLFFITHKAYQRHETSIYLSEKYLIFFNPHREAKACFYEQNILFGNRYSFLTMTKVLWRTEIGKACAPGRLEVLGASTPTGL